VPNQGEPFEDNVRGAKRGGFVRRRVFTLPLRAAGGAFWSRRMEHSSNYDVSGASQATATRLTAEFVTVGEKDVQQQVPVGGGAIDNQSMTTSAEVRTATHRLPRTASISFCRRCYLVNIRVGVQKHAALFNNRMYGPVRKSRCIRSICFYPAIYDDTVKQESCAIAKMTAQCAPYMGSLKNFGTPCYFSQNFSWAFVLIHPMNIPAKLEVCSYLFLS